jgi:hypothetical protein
LEIEGRPIANPSFSYSSFSALMKLGAISRSGFVSSLALFPQFSTDINPDALLAVDYRFGASLTNGGAFNSVPGANPSCAHAVDRSTLFLDNSSSSPPDLQSQVVQL